MLLVAAVVFLIGAAFSPHEQEIEFLLWGIFFLLFELVRLIDVRTRP